MLIYSFSVILSHHHFCLHILISCSFGHSYLCSFPQIPDLMQIGVIFFFLASVNDCLASDFYLSMCIPTLELNNYDFFGPQFSGKCALPHVWTQQNILFESHSLCTSLISIQICPIFLFLFG